MYMTQLENIQKLKFIKEHGFTYCNTSKISTFEGTVIQSLLEKIIIHKYRLSHIFNQLKYESDQLSLKSIKTILLKILENRITIDSFYKFFESSEVVSEIAEFGYEVLKKKNFNQAIKDLAIEILVFNAREQNIRKHQPFDEKNHLVVPVLITDSNSLEFMILYKESRNLDDQMNFVTFDQERSINALKNIFYQAFNLEKLENTSKKVVESMLEKFPKN